MVRQEQAKLMKAWILNKLKFLTSREELKWRNWKIKRPKLEEVNH